MNKYEQNLNILLAEYKDGLEGNVNGEDFGSMFSVNRTESPIEKILYIQMNHDILFLSHYDDMQILPQQMIKRESSYIRVDFLIKVKHSGKEINVVVECDGHDFHEKTKEQAQKDKSRDRFLVSKGYYVFRFTGSEIYRNARIVSEEVSAFIFNKFHGEEIKRLAGG